jgi:hypothetical protein
MHVESTNVVYQDPSIFSLPPLVSFGQLVVVYIAPIEKLAVGGKVQLTVWSPNNPIPSTGQSDACHVS